MVSVPFGHRRALGIVVEKPVHAAVDKLKSIHRIIDPQRIDAHQLTLLHWCWRYYQHAPGEVLAAAIPSVLRTSKPYQLQPLIEYYLTASGTQQTSDAFGRAHSQLKLWKALKEKPQTSGQLRALLPSWTAVYQRLRDKGWADQRPIQSATDSISQAQPVTLSKQQAKISEQFSHQLQNYHCCLLYGVTGSGKTEVYIDLMRRVLATGHQALLLVPEIGLIEQLVQRIEQQLAAVVNTFHSAMSNQQRAQTWLAARYEQCQVVVGTRSAVFLPFAKPGVFIIDEEHDPGYKQFEGFHYSARDVAIKRAQLLDIPVLLGSATPSLESLANVQQQRYTQAQLTKRHAEGALPDWSIVDCRNMPFVRQGANDTEAAGLLHSDTYQAMRTQLQAGQQLLVFQNRRGYAPLLQCGACGWQADCQRCSAHMTWHRQANRLQCHHCEFVQPQPQHCPACAAPELSHYGSGTEQLEQVLAETFEEWPVYRVDSDSMRKRQAMQHLRSEVLSGKPCILVGTQMLTKGHHFPNITLVVVIDIDQALFSADYRATERLAQQLVQVAGRAGRGQQAGRILLQTRQPDHPLLHLLTKADYQQVAEQLLIERQQTQFPPYSAQVIVRANATKPAVVEQFLKQAKRAALQLNLPGELLGPVPALLEKRAGRYRYQLWWQTERRETLQRALPSWVAAINNMPQANKVRWHIDVDPVAL